MITAFWAAEEILPMHVVGGVGWPVGLLRSSPPAYDAAAELAADVGVGTSSYTEYDLQITKAAEDWLQDDARTKAPWAGFISFVSPHYPLTCPEDFASSKAMILKIWICRLALIIRQNQPMPN